MLAEYASGFFTFHNKMYGTNVDVSALESYSFHKVLNLSKDEILHRMNLFHNTEEFKHLLPVVGAKDALNQLSSHSKLIAITARSQDIQQHTQDWLETHFQKKIEKIHFARNVHIGETKNKSKADFCREAGVNVMIEDSFENACDCSSNGILTFLIDKPWNQGTLPNKVIRVKSWNEIVKSIPITEHF